ncbi:hypothetical protein F4604DRAFT_1683358 [Suillus subluteus]|nr:hypothetical protein F4604DRAFT_1683358 [Suillus subluteus]
MSYNATTSLFKLLCTPPLDFGNCNLIFCGQVLLVIQLGTFIRESTPSIVMCWVFRRYLSWCNELEAAEAEEHTQKLPKGFKYLLQYSLFDWGCWQAVGGASIDSDVQFTS